MATDQEKAKADADAKAMADKDAKSLQAAQDKIAQLEAELAERKAALGTPSGTITVDHTGKVVTD